MTASASIALNNRLEDLSEPQIMGIMNVTPDSFYAESRKEQRAAIDRRVREIFDECADIIDIGGYSSRPGASEVSADEEFRRLAQGIEAARELSPELPISVDTFRAEVAARCIDDYGVEIINDISGGSLDPEIWDVVAEKKKAYVLMHMRGTPATMASLTDYPRGVVAEVVEDLAFKADALHSKGVADVIIDPGLGFAKTFEQNYELLANLGAVKELGMPVLIGLSRKSMVTKLLDATADSEEALWGTLALQTLALAKGTDILRVHDVRAARAVMLPALITAYTPIDDHKIEIIYK